MKELLFQYWYVCASLLSLVVLKVFWLFGFDWPWLIKATKALSWFVFGSAEAIGRFLIPFMDPTFPDHHDKQPGRDEGRAWGLTMLALATFVSALVVLASGIRWLW